MSDISNVTGWLSDADAVVTFSAESATAKELDRQLSLNESILRTKLLRPDA